MSSILQVNESKISTSTGLMNLWSARIGGVPMCHGAGGMAGCVQFGARTGAHPSSSASCHRARYLQPESAGFVASLALPEVRYVEVPFNVLKRRQAGLSDFDGITA